jgi:hypothetical protein
LYARIPSEIKIRFFDVHAEATSEKQALAFLYANKVSVVYGTHTHVPTADERIIDGYTGFVTDLGLTGPYDSLIGMDKNKAINKLVTGAKKPRLEPANKDLWFCAILVDIDPQDGRCASIERIQMRFGG